MHSGLTVQPARPQELELAFHLQFQTLAEEERRWRVAEALAIVRNGELDPAGVLLACLGSEPFGVMICQLAPGASALVWPPSVREGDDQTALEDALVQHAARWLRQSGAKLAHALLSDKELIRKGALERNGFRHVTRLWYLRHDLKNLPSFSPRLHCLPYSACSPACFHETLLRTYEGTLDCPEINHVRTPEEVLAGHRANGLYDPLRWWLVHAGPKPIGVLLLTNVPALGGWELSYLGIVPEARRQGAGRELTCKALWEAYQAGAPQLNLALDARNGPASELYRRLGFETCDHREVLLAIWPAEAR